MEGTPLRPYARALAEKVRLNHHVHEGGSLNYKKKDTKRSNSSMAEDAPFFLARQGSYEIENSSEGQRAYVSGRF